MSKLSHAGGIVVRLDKDEPRYLLITAKDNLRLKVFPKGHIEANESVTETALREVGEEAGIEGEIITRVDVLEIQRDNEAFSVEFYLIRYIRNTKSGEERKIYWCTYDEALKLLSFEESRNMLHKANAIVLKLLKNT